MTKKILLINPNTNVQTTEAMVRRAREVVAADVEIVGETVRLGESLITDEAALSRSADSVLNLVEHYDLTGYCGIIIAAYGDPGLLAVRRKVAIPVVGIGESSIKAAMDDGRRFAVVTTTPGLKASMERQIAACGGASSCAGVFLTVGDPNELMRTPDGLAAALSAAASAAIATHGAEVIVIGGGPLGAAAPYLRAEFPAHPVLEPVVCAVRALLSRAAL